jgi:hypothetical protein
MSMHITRFIDSIKAHESRGQRDFAMSMRDARDLMGDITKLLLRLDQAHQTQSNTATVVDMQVSGGDFVKYADNRTKDSSEPT